MITPNLLVGFDKCAIHDNDLAVNAIVENDGYPLIFASCPDDCILVFSPIHLERRYYITDRKMKIEVMADGFNNIPEPIIDYYTWVIYDVRRYRK